MNRLRVSFLRGAVILLCILGGVFLAAVFSHLAYGSDDQVIAQARQLEVNAPDGVAFWQTTIAAEGGKHAYELFGKAYDGLEINKQHTYAHIFGEALYKELGIKGIAVCDKNYNFGCYHAFFGWALIDNGLDIITELDQACIDTYGEKGLGCQHGIGHGIIAELGNDHLDDALEACTRLNWQGPLGGCTSGVFMEFNFSTMSGFSNRELDEHGLYYPCDAVADRFTMACYFEQSSWWIVLYDGDYARVGQLCAAVKNDDDRVTCFQGVGNVISGKSFNDLDDIRERCGAMPTKEGQFRCIEGATWTLANQPEFKDVWRTLCTPYEETEYYDRCIKNKDLI